MDILKNKPMAEKPDQFDYFSSEREELARKQAFQESRPAENYAGKVFARWQAREFEIYERDKKWYAYISLILIAIIGYAVYSNSLVMAITFILIGVILYLQFNKEPKIIDFAITAEGVIAGQEIFDFEHIQSFWIFYNPPHEKYLSLHTRGHLVPYVHIAIADQNPVELREILLKYVPEIKQDLRLADMLERFLRI